MPSLFPRAAAFGRKLSTHLALLRRDPEQFARNVTQFTHPDLYERRLADVVLAPAMAVRMVDNDAPPILHVLDTAWSRMGMTGGPNTVINLACRVARRGVRVQFVSTASPVTLDPAWFRQHCESLLGAPPPDVGLESAADPANPLTVRPHDMFMATHWSTAHQLRAVLPRMATPSFFYMVQEWEPGFYAWSSNHALALATFEMDFRPVINEAILADFLFSQPFGRWMDPAIQSNAMVFEPAVDGTMFRPDDRPRHGPRRLLFYARPTNARNMFGLGLAALRAASADSAFADWEFLAIGGRGSVPAMALSNGHQLRQAPWVDYAGYGDLLRSADILLCPMISPHTSYPVLEMAACGGLALTNSFATKTASRLEALSPNIMAVPPSLEGFQEGLVRAARAVNDGRDRQGILRLPRQWDETLEPVAARVAATVLAPGA